MRRVAAGVAAAVAATLLWASPAPAVATRNPPPPASLAGPAIDAHLGYMKQTTCSPSAKPGTSALLRALIRTWGGSSSGISRGCGVGTTSEHKEGRALDWRMNVRNSRQRRRVDQALAWLTANNGEVAYRLGVMYVIWNQRIWSLYYPELGWRKMADRGSYTANHKDHVHISLSWDGAMKQTSWWTGVPLTVPLNGRCGPTRARACLPTIPRTSRAWPYQATEVPQSFLPAPWTKPGIGGGPQVGRTLTVVPGTWVPDGATLAFQWQADGRDVAGATAATFEVGPEQVARELRVVVSATTAAGSVTKVSDGTTAVLKGRFTARPRPQLAGTVAAGQVVSAVPGDWAPVPDRLSYAWQRNGRTIQGATGVTYTPRASDVGDRLAVRVTARRAGFLTASATSRPVTVARGVPTATTPPAVTGDPVVGGTLTADPGSWVPTPTTLAYQWFVGGTAVPGATTPTLVLLREHAGASVEVRVRVGRSGYATAEAWSAPVGVAAG